MTLRNISPNLKELNHSSASTAHNSLYGIKENIIALGELRRIIDFELRSQSSSDVRSNHRPQQVSCIMAPCSAS